MVINGFGQQADTLQLPYAINPSQVNPYEEVQPSSNINLKDPQNVTTEVEYDAQNNQYIIHKKVGDVDIVPPYTMTFEEYNNYDVQKGLQNYWRQRYQGETFEHQSSLIPKINVGSEAFETIFGSNTIDIKPQGSATLRFGVKIDKNENPTQPVDLQKNTAFDFKEEIQMNVTGKIGDNLEMKVSYNTETSFDFENKMNLRYQGKEDDILQKIEAGDVSLPLTTSLITGSQSLFGILTELKFGKLYVTSVFSQQKGETKTITVEGGAQKSNYNLRAVDYDKNRNFFLSQYFRTHYDEALSNLPNINSPIQITKIEVWVTNTTKSTDNARNILALMDLGEENYKVNIYDRQETVVLDMDKIILANKDFPENDANSLYKSILDIDDSIRNINSVTKLLTAYGYQGGRQFEKVELARKLSSSDYTLNDKLGYISLNSALNADEVLAVAFEYTINGKTYKVGDLSSDGIEGYKTLFVKLLKGTSFSPSLPNWGLMMKNIYSIGAYQVNKDDFVMEVGYYDDETGTRLFNLPEKTLPDSVRNSKLLKLLNLDQLNSQLNYVKDGDGVFDFVDGVTIKASNGKIIFPVLEPFGGYMKQILQTEAQKNKYVFQALYDSTQYKAEQITSKNKYTLSGSYKSAGGSDIYLNAFNIPEGSVTVTAGGIKLIENVDYTVDYNMGRVKIVNESYLASGTPIKISLESNSMFSIQSKTLMGTHLDYRFNDDFNLGATVMHLTEKPLTEKVNIGEEPISNTIWGLNGSYRTDVPFLTRMVDFLPLIETKEKSSVSFEGEFAQLIPGHNKAIGSKGEAFIDDFEGSESTIDLKSKTGWVLASTPQLQENLFPEAKEFDKSYGFNRAKLAWYQIDPLFFKSGTPVSTDQQSSLKVYRVEEQDIYPNKETQNGIPTEISTLDLAFYPDERGPYNYETTGVPNISSGLTPDGKLKDPEKRWGGIMRELSTNDFESTNVEYIEFWMMDPFVEDDSLSQGGELYFNLGNVSEDILKDGRKSYEQGLPTDYPAKASEYDETDWGRVPAFQTSNSAFVNDGTIRSRQDVGLDGLSSTLETGGITDEAFFFSDYLNKIVDIITVDSVREAFNADPSNDNYHYFRGGDYDTKQLNILERYKNYNNQEGNTPVSSQSGESYNTVGQQMPDVEDINGDFTLNESESYFQYKVNLKKDDMVVGKNNITDIQEASIKLKNGNRVNVNWYQFKIPINDYNQKFGEIQDFKSIRFMRMFMHGWQSSVVLRFAKLELVRSEWRKYDNVIKESDEGVINDNESVDLTYSPFSVATVNIEENGKRYPVNYVLPPGVDRQQDPSNQQLRKLNEQSMALKVDSLNDGYSKAVYKTINMDMRDYGKLQMYVHAESRYEEDPLNDDDLTCFVRIGSDYTDNYYEFEVPMKVTPWLGKPYDQNSTDSRTTVWPTDNNIEITFSDLLLAKEQRNDAMRTAGSSVSLIKPYIMMVDATHKITVKGNPNLANVQTIMVGIRNPLERWNAFSKDDNGRPKSAEVWVNELRLTDFNEQGGWAATGRMTARLADFATISVAGSTTQPGFGSIEQTAQERSKEETNQIDVATNMELGKFFPKEANVRVPLFLGYSRTAINPKYNPLDEDIPLDVAVKSDYLTEAEKKDLVKNSQDLTERKSLNLTNVGIGRSGKGNPTFYSPSNLSASYAYSELSHSDIGTDYDYTKNHNGSLSYIFNSQPKVVEPFKKNKLLKKPAFRLIGDFNFYYAPSQISFITAVNRQYSETLLRNLNNPSQVYTPTYDKAFNWTRQFDLKYNFSKGLKFNLSMNTAALIDEPDGRVDKGNREDYQTFKDSVLQSILSFGTPNTFNQKFDASYTVPINKIPLLNWVSSTARYSSAYDWMRGSTAKVDSLDQGNTIKNSQKMSLNTQLNMDNLYGKVGFLDKILKKYKKSKKQRNEVKFEDVVFKKERVKLQGNTGKTITHNLKTEDEIKVTVTTQAGKPVKSSFEIINENKVSVKVDRDAEDLVVEVKGKRAVKNNPFIQVLEQGALFAMGVKQVSGNYDLTNGTVLSGYRTDHRLENMYYDPGIAFVFGKQNPNLASDFAESGKLIDNPYLISPYVMTTTTNIDLKATYQPYKDLRIDFTGKRTESKITNEKYTPEQTGPNSWTANPSSYSETGAYSTSILMLSSAFGKKPSVTDYSSGVFDEYKNNIRVVAWRLAENRRGRPTIDYFWGDSYNPQYNADSMPFGYSASNPDVAIPAFLATYSGLNSNSAKLDFKSWKYFRPNWRLKYDGLTQIEWLAKYFRNLTVSHGYNATFTVGNYSSNTAYDYESASKVGLSWATKSANDTLFLSQYDISSFSAVEQFMPLFGIEMTWKNNILTKFEYKKTRALTMNLVNTQMTEVYSWEYVIGSGYRFDKLKIVINNKPIVSDLNLRADISFQNNLTISRNLYQENENITAGQKRVAITFTADYQLSDKLTLQGYYKHNSNNPATGSTFRTASTEFGFEVRFSLAQN